VNALGALLLVAFWPLLVGASPVEVRILVLGPVPAPLVKSVKQGLEAALPVRVTSVEHGRLPRSAWYAPRKRYRADRLLDHLAAWLGDAEARCVMQDAGGSIANTDGGTGLLEPGCAAQLEALSR
jgi:hypothetical protein